MEKRPARMITTVAVLLALGIAAYLAYMGIGRWHREKLDTALQQQQRQWQNKTSRMDRQIEALQKELHQFRQMETPEPPQKVAEALGQSGPALLDLSDKPLRCGEIDQRVSAFLAYLDRRDYIRSYELEGGIDQEFREIVRLLAANPPRVVGETEDLMTLMHNLAHFFRVLGPKRIRLIKDILIHESDVMESLMAAFYLWFDAYGRCEDTIGWRPSLATLYDYAGYFTETLAGKSYLARRDLKVRLLTRYYCVLLLDRANDEKLNANGIDIRPHIKFLISDFSYQRGFVYQKHYLKQLLKLKKKYQI
jgi:hypothetical protein